MAISGESLCIEVVIILLASLSASSLALSSMAFAIFILSILASSSTLFKSSL